MFHRILYGQKGTKQIASFDDTNDMPKVSENDSVVINYNNSEKVTNDLGNDEIENNTKKYKPVFKS